MLVLLVSYIAGAAGDVGDDGIGDGVDGYGVVVCGVAVVVFGGSIDNMVRRHCCVDVDSGVAAVVGVVCYVGAVVGGCVVVVGGDDVGIGVGCFVVLVMLVLLVALSVFMFVVALMPLLMVGV